MKLLKTFFALLIYYSYNQLYDVYKPIELMIWCIYPYTYYRAFFGLY